MNALAGALHPASVRLRVAERRRESDTSATFRLVPAVVGAELPPFRAGQYVSLRVAMDGAAARRPFSLSSSPDESRDGGYWEVTVKAKPDGYCAPYMLDRWREGETLSSSGPAGTFYYEPLRDGARLACVAGGSGITPFKAIIADVLGHHEASITLIQGASCPDELLFSTEFDRLAAAYPGRLRLVRACVEAEDGWEGERGMLSKGLLAAAVPDPASAAWFVCGPEAMKESLAASLADLGVRRGRVRLESSAGAGGPAAYAGYVAPPGPGPFMLEVRTGALGSLVPASPDETILTALERAGLEPPSLCRSGECGWCRARLVAGRAFSPGDGVSGGLRAADVKFGFIHPCRSYPLTDMVLEVPENPERA
jgi:ferredoxin-NADP reductase